MPFGKATGKISQMMYFPQAELCCSKFALGLWAGGRGAVVRTRAVGIFGTGGAHPSEGDRGRVA